MDLLGLVVPFVAGVDFVLQVLDVVFHVGQEEEDEVQGAFFSSGASRTLYALLSIATRRSRWTLCHDYGSELCLYLHS